MSPKTTSRPQAPITVGSVGSLRIDRLPVVALALTLLVAVGCDDGATPPFAAPVNYRAGIEALGEQIFNDTNLSSPPGQSCATCHSQARAFTDARPDGPTSQGAVEGVFGVRNAPTVAYLAFAPPLHFSDADQTYEGGLFVDGRVNSLEAQMQKPLLNPLEMNNADAEEVMAKIRVAAYAPELVGIFGQGALDDAKMGFDAIAQAVAAFERTPIFQPFSSKYDLYLQHRTGLSKQELRGLRLFQEPSKGNCAACHPSTPGVADARALFTDFSYDNIGIPKNPSNPYYTLAADLNPEGANHLDHGLATTLADPAQDGRFRVPTLRNIAVTAPYGHNGFFADLKSIVRFYNTRDTDPTWPAPEIPGTVNRDELGHLGLSDAEVDDVVAFLGTLSDGYAATP
jgi:cytochrome c peroxidase